MTGAQTLLLAVVVSGAVFAPVTALLAGRRERSFGLWLVLGAVAGPLAILVLALAPPGRCPSCGASVPGWPPACPSCAMPFNREATDARGGPTRDGRSATRSRPASPITPASTTSRALSDSWRAAVRAVVSPEDDPADEIAMIATAVYVSGSGDCEPGMHYVLARRGDDLVVIGPVETRRHIVAVDRPLETLRVSGFRNGLLISLRDRGRGWSLAFQDFSGGSPASVEQAMVAGGSVAGLD